MATVATTDQERARALSDGERLLRDECVSHCYEAFYQCAIDVALAGGDWAAAERYAQQLEDYVRDEPLPFIEFLIGRGRALAAGGRGDVDRDKLVACQAQAREWKLADYLPALDAAVASLALNA
jgi:hypothetical protein